MVCSLGSRGGRVWKLTLSLMAISTASIAVLSGSQTTLAPASRRDITDYSERRGDSWWVYIDNRSTTPIRVVNGRIYDCVEVGLGCGGITTGFTIDPGETGRIAVVNRSACTSSRCADQPETRFKYSYSYTYERAVASAGRTTPVPTRPPGAEADSAATPITVSDRLGGGPISSPVTKRPVDWSALAGKVIYKNMTAGDYAATSHSVTVDGGILTISKIEETRSPRARPGTKPLSHDTYQVPISDLDVSTVKAIENTTYGYWNVYIASRVKSVTVKYESDPRTNPPTDSVKLEYQTGVEAHAAVEAVIELLESSFPAR